MRTWLQLLISFKWVLWLCSSNLIFFPSLTLSLFTLLEVLKKKKKKNWLKVKQASEIIKPPVWTMDTVGEPKHFSGFQLQCLPSSGHSSAGSWTGPHSLCRWALSTCRSWLPPTLRGPQTRARLPGGKTDSQPRWGGTERSSTAVPPDAHSRS